MVNNIANNITAIYKPTIHKDFYNFHIYQFKNGYKKAVLLSARLIIITKLNL